MGNQAKVDGSLIFFPLLWKTMEVNGIHQLFGTNILQNIILSFQQMTETLTT